jgi:PadR family transcriptional regulator PadR
MATPSQRFERSVTKDNLWIYILSLLKKREMYPYELKKSIESDFGFSPGNVTAYIVLKKLKAGGYVKTMRKDRGKGPERTFFMITQKGMGELEKAREIIKKVKF